MAKKKVSNTPQPRKAKPTTSTSVPSCGLCGKTENLMKTECCGNWVCDDEHKYQLFSYAKNSCSRNHRRFTLCGHHFNEGHPGDWQDCPKCRKEYETEIYVYYGTNEYNFEVLADPPAFEPTKCAACGKVIDLGAGGYSISSAGYRCGRCMNKDMRKK